MKKHTGKFRIKKPSVIRRTGAVDMYLLITFLALIVFGVLMVASASGPYALKIADDYFYYFQRDLVFAILSCILMLIVSLIDYRLYRKYALFFYIFPMLLCLLIFTPLGETTNGARRWFRIGQFTFMPSDLLKVGSIIFLSRYLSSRRLEENGTLSHLMVVLFFVGITILPILLQPNLSAFIVISLTLLALYYMGGMNNWHIPLLIFLALVAIFVLYKFGPDYAKLRIQALLHPNFDPTGASWQPLQSRYAVSSGGFFGLGFGESRIKYDNLADEPHNDFIFAVLCEELGFIGAFFFLLTYCFLIYRALWVSGQARSNFGRLLGYGLTFLIALQAMVNIGVAIGLLPPTGITLPFISYGGSSLLVMSGIAGILLNISKDSI